jgi:N-methylhydantoinase A
MVRRLAVDIGGTFVDAIEFDHGTGKIGVEKVPTTRAEPSEGVLDAVETIDTDLAETAAFVHGTTLGLNALLEREGATTGILTNEGFRDVFEIGRYNLPEEDMYNLDYRPPESLVPRRRRLGVPGRLDADGEEVEPLDEDAVRAAAAELADDHGVDAVAICFLNAYRNPDHERRAAQLVRETAPDVSVSVSSDITREYREYERTSTTVLDAYIKPIFESYVDDLDGALRSRGFDGEFFITRSGGGALGAESAKTAPVQTVFSGPAGGLIGASAVGEATGRDDLIAVDMGGTSLDACVVQDGSPSVEYEAELEHHPLMIPVYDLRTIGAGGGSIAWLDRGLLKVGPRSAGADPGPICYGRGGTDPTVTDAALALGFVDPDNFLGGEMALDAAGAREGIRERLAEPLDATVAETSRAVFDITLANTVSAIREITVEKGLDPREFSMVAYGGAGPILVPLVAREMGVEEVLVPQAPAVFSAWGMLMADVVHDFSRTFVRLLSDVSVDDLRERFESLEERTVARLEEDGFAPADQAVERTIGMRYFGQEHTVDVPLGADDGIDDLRERFERNHERRYGHVMDDPAEVVLLRVRGTGVTDKPAIERASGGDGDARVGTREAYCFAAGEHRPFDVYRRAGLAPGDVLEGPAIVREPTTTLVFYSDQRARVDEFGHVVVEQGVDR